MIQGGATEARVLFEQLSAGGTIVNSTGYTGTLANLGGDAFVGLRTVSTGTGSRAMPVATIDVNISRIAIKELKFIP